MAKQIVTLPGGIEAVPHRLKCAISGCRKNMGGYLGTDQSPGGRFYNKKGELLADLREVDFVCTRHGVVDGSAPFLYEDKG